MQTQNDKLFNYLEKVRALLAKAERTDNEAEKIAFMEKAQQLMVKYRIDEEQLIASGDPAAIEPIKIQFDLCDARSEFVRQYRSLATTIAYHVGAQIVFISCTREGKCAGIMVGYESDLRVGLELITAAQMVFSEKLEPKFDAARSEAENIYRLRSSGITRRNVANILWGSEKGETAAAHARVGKVYKEECAKRGETPALDGKGIDLLTFRRSYAANFLDRLDDRLRAARSAVDAQGGVMVLHGRKERVLEAYYTFFPQFRPDPEAMKKWEEDAAAAAVVAKPRKPRRWTQADEARWQRENNSAAARAGQRAGADAADAVRISRTTPRTNRLDESSGTTPAREAIAG
jgi:hypothetical protein